MTEGAFALALSRTPRELAGLPTWETTSSLQPRGQIRLIVHRIYLFGNVAKVSPSEFTGALLRQGSDQGLRESDSAPRDDFPSPQCVTESITFYYLTDSEFDPVKSRTSEALVTSTKSCPTLDQLLHSRTAPTRNAYVCLAVPDGNHGCKIVSSKINSCARLDESQNCPQIERREFDQFANNPKSDSTRLRWSRVTMCQ